MAQKLRISFKSSNRDLVVENPTEVQLSPMRVVSIRVATREGETKYLIPFENINYMEDATDTPLVRPAGAIIKGDLN